MSILLEMENLKIKPEGETMTLIFEKSGHSCGRAYRGIGFSTSLHRGGSVITIDDALLLRDWLNERIKEAIELTPQDIK